MKTAVDGDRAGDDLPGTGELDDPLLAALLEEFTDRIRAGEALDATVFARAHPERADEIRRVFPLLETLARLDDPDGAYSAAGSELDMGAPARRTLGDFRLVQEIGRGGMGIVYRAEQLSLERTVALKVLPFAAVLDPRQIQRFKNEAQAAAQLHHTHIVPVYSVGCERGVHYYAMQFIDGQSLAQAIGELRRLEEKDNGKVKAGARAAGPSPRPGKSGSASPLGGPTGTTSRNPAHMRSVARLGAQAAEALDHAHELGIVHRDVKPANLLVDDRAHLWLTDFGLAHCRSDTGLTLSGDLLGTLRYMSPEQALAKRVALDGRTDIYSLGATLYELLTLAPAFDGRDREELLRRIAFEEPRSPRKLNPAVPPDLETIVLKAMDKDPARRYATASDLAADLERFLDDRPIRARRPNVIQRAARHCRRHWKGIGATVALLVLIATVSVLAFGRYQARRVQALAERRTEYETAVRARKMQLLRSKAMLRAMAGTARDLPDRGLFVPGDSVTLAIDESLGEVRQGLADLVESLPGGIDAHEARYYLAEALALSGDVQEARHQLRIALRLNPVFAPAVALEGELARDERGPARVEAWLRQHPRASWQRDWLEAHAARARGRLAEAERAYGRLIDAGDETHPGGELYLGATVDLFLARGLVRVELEDFPGAMEDFAVARHEGSRFFEPALLLGKAEYLAGHAEGAARTFESLHRNSGSRDETAMWISIVYLDLGSYAMSLRWAERIEDPAIRGRLRSECLMSPSGAEDNHRQAILERSTAALENDPGDLPARLVAISCHVWNRYRGIGNAETALTLYDEVIQLDPDNVPARALLALGCLWRGEGERALRLVDELQDRRRRGTYLDNFAENCVLSRTGRNERLREALDRQAEEADRAPWHLADWYAFRGILLARDGEHRRAIASFQEAIVRKSQVEWYVQHMCRQFHRLGEYDEAARCFREAVEVKGFPCAVGLAQSLLELGEPENAASALCERIARHPGEDSVQRTLLQIVRRYGDSTLPADLTGVHEALEEASRVPGASPTLWTTLAFLNLHGRDVDAAALARAREAISRALEGTQQAEPLAILAELEHADDRKPLAVWTLERALSRWGATRSHRALLERWRDEPGSALRTFASIDAALARFGPEAEKGLALLESFPTASTDPREERRRVYLEGRLFQRSGEFEMALECYRKVLTRLGTDAPEPHLRLGECLVALDRTEEAERYLRGILETGTSVRAELYYTWLDVALGGLDRSPRECLDQLSSSRSDRLVDDLRWLLGELAANGAIRIDCGGRTDHTDPRGAVWGKDRFYRGGWRERQPPTVRQSDDPLLYQLSRLWDHHRDWDRPGYVIPVRRGRQEVTLHLCEGWAGAPGVRVFDVLAEGKLVADLAGYDGFARDGFGVAAIYPFTVDVDDGLLEIEFRFRHGGAAVAAIEVHPVE